MSGYDLILWLSQISHHGRNGGTYLALDLGEKKVEQKCGVFCVHLISSVVLCDIIVILLLARKLKSQRV